MQSKKLQDWIFQTIIVVVDAVAVVVVVAVRKKKGKKKKDVLVETKRDETRRVDRAECAVGRRDGALVLHFSVAEKNVTNYLSQSTKLFFGFALYCMHGDTVDSPPSLERNCTEL